MEFTDSHVHLDDQQFDSIRQEVIGRAIEAGVTRMICIGTDAKTSRKSVEIAKAHSSVYAAVGIQPNHTTNVSPDDWPQIKSLAKDPKVIAIGETGLDHYWDYAPLDIQEDYFERHLELSRTANLPFIIHMRDPKAEAVADGVSPVACADHIFQVVQRFAGGANLRGVMHSFTGDADYASRFLDLGLHISFAGMVTFKKSHELRKVARIVPDDRLLIETDAPYLSPHPKRGQRPNEPALVVHTAECLAEVRGVSLQDIARITTANAKSLFGIE